MNYVKKIEESFSNFNVSLKIFGVLKTYDGFVLVAIPKHGKDNSVQRIRNAADKINDYNVFSTISVEAVNGLILLIMRDSKLSLYDLKPLLPLLKNEFNDMELPFILGKDKMGAYCIEDLPNLIHVLYSGSTGSGKSVGLRALVSCLIATRDVSDVNLVVISMLSNSLDELSDSIFLSYPIVKDHMEAVNVLEALVSEVDRRLSMSREEFDQAPYIVTIIDEAPRLVDDSYSKEYAQKAEAKLSTLLQTARKAKIILVLASQNATIKTMKSDIGNITTRLAYRFGKSHSSYAAINNSGAERLKGKGRFLYNAVDIDDPVEIQGPCVSDQDWKQIIAESNERNYGSSTQFTIAKVIAEDSNDDIMPETSVFFEENTYEDDGHDESIEPQELCEIILWAFSQKTVSANKITDKFKMGKRVEKIMGELTRLGIIDELRSKQPRKVIPTSDIEVPNNVLTLLLNHGFDLKTIKQSFNGRTAE